MEYGLPTGDAVLARNAATTTVWLVFSGWNSMDARPMTGAVALTLNAQVGYDDTLTATYGAAVDKLYTNTVGEKSGSSTPVLDGFCNDCTSQSLTPT